MRHFFSFLFSLISLFFIGCGAEGEKSDVSATNLKLLVPLYAYPNSNSSWPELIALKQKYPSVEIVAIVNQSNGTFDANSTSFYNGIKALSDANIIPIGYVNTQNATRTVQEVQTDVDQWVLYYKDVGLKGMFFDVASSHANTVTYYKTVSEYTKSKDLSLIVLNPGTTVDEEFFQNNVASIIVTREEFYSVGINSTNFNTPTNSTSLAALLHDAPQTIALETLCSYANTHQFEYIYVTDDGADGNPWDELATNLEQQLLLIQQGCH